MQRLSLRVYHGASRNWIWVISDLGSTLLSGTAPSKNEALIRGRNARREFVAEMPGYYVVPGDKRLAKAAKIARARRAGV